MHAIEKVYHHFFLLNMINHIFISLFSKKTKTIVIRYRSFDVEQTSQVNTSVIYAI